MPRKAKARRQRAPKPTRKRCEPAASIIKKLGGAIVVAKIVGTSYTAPYRWRAPRSEGGCEGIIPFCYHNQLRLYARSIGKRLDKVDFLPSLPREKAG